jgi:hypothetical protein
MAAVFSGFVIALIVFAISLVSNEVLLLGLSLFIYFNCRQQWIILEEGSDESMLGYDFSEGYTSLERDDEPAPRKPSWFQRWRERRAARKLQREQEERARDEARLDELLDKIHRLGQQSLTEEEQRFMRNVSDKKRNRN